MKSTLVRVLALSIVFAGLAATSAAAPATNAVMAKGVGGLPIPACGPNDPTHCGMD